MALRTPIRTRLVLLFLAFCVAGLAEGKRKIVSLDGSWEIAEGAMNKIPAKFDHRVPVPGLADMAEPPFEDVGVKSDRREAFWYRRTFRISGPLPSVGLLKIGKAKYGTRVYLNGRLVGDHIPCFTPGWFNVRPYLRGSGESNELIVRVGAGRESLPSSVPRGWDFEKIKYIPGIYDSVELILTGNPRIVRVQAVPDLPTSTVRAVVLLRNDGPPTSTDVNFTVRKAVSGAKVGVVPAARLSIGKGRQATVEARIPIKNCRPWSPDDPFLYRLEVQTGGDSLAVRFGMRSLEFDPKTGRAVLNGRPYFMRGTNVCVYRFFEDPSRGDRPWRAEWVRRLHRAFKSMHWNSIRYCIGFPPEIWYEIADEEGFLIQDEFPIWYGGKWPAELKSEEIARQYTEWMRERWNHPCVVIWDAQNETRTAEIGKAIRAVRHLDLSNRPWDNGWSEAQAPTDPVESHPYFFSRPTFRLSDLARRSATPRVQAPNGAGHPIIINEYGWLWLNRNGTVTKLTEKVYRNLLGENPSRAVLRRTYARYLAALTEFWRCHRRAAAVMHFCGLGYSRPNEPRGQTSDHFVDIEKLTFEADFRKYVREAFAPVGLMIDEWAEELPAGQMRDFRIVVINDRYEDWKGKVVFRILQKGEPLFEWTEPCEVKALGDKRLSIAAAVPSKPGDYQLVAELVRPGAEPVHSLRDFKVLSARERRARDGIAVGRKVTASSSLTIDGVSYPARLAVDGRRATRWSSEFSDPQWLEVDLGEEFEVSGVVLLWENAYGKAYSIEVSLDGKTWKEVFKTNKGDGGEDVVRFKPTRARYVRFSGTRRGTPFGYSLWEMKVFGKPVVE